jgi:hypothetical protein
MLPLMSKMIPSDIGASSLDRWRMVCQRGAVRSGWAHSRRHVHFRLLLGQGHAAGQRQEHRQARKPFSTAAYGHYCAHKDRLLLFPTRGPEERRPRSTVLSWMRVEWKLLLS